MNDPTPSPRTDVPLSALEGTDAFIARHIGTTPGDQAMMLAALHCPSRAALMDAIVPASIRRATSLAPFTPAAIFTLYAFYPFYGFGVHRIIFRQASLLQAK